MACTVDPVPVPEIQVEDSGGNLIADGGNFAFAATTTVGTPVDETFTVRNLGTATLTISTDPPSTSGDFSAGAFGALSLAPGESTTFTVTCSATTEATPANGTVTFNNTDADENPFNFGVACTVGDDDPPIVIVDSDDSDDGDDLPPPPPTPLCADIDGATDEIVRANIPPQVSLTVFCRIIARDYVFIRSNAEIGILSVLQRGVIHAVDVFSPSGASGAGSRVCLQGSGTIIFIGEVVGTQPEVAVPLTANVIEGYTCAIIPSNGKVVLVVN